MTIGIAASGPRAGLAILEGLKAAEAVGHGALHGFVSLVAIGPDGLLHRLEVQDGGTAALLAGRPLPARLADATRAGLMSSGPNRPSPLSQFTPADAAVGLVTGHRFPNSAGRQGTPMNLDILGLMRCGLDPETALSRIVADNPSADAGFIAVARDGRVQALNTPYLAGFGDAGQAIVASPDGRASVAILHNAIRPHRCLAGLVAEVALSILQGDHAADAAVVMTAGVPLRLGGAIAIEIDETGKVSAIEVSDARYLAGSWSLGLGYRTRVRRGGVRLGYALYEPYLLAANGTIVTIDGGASASLPIRLDASWMRRAPETE